MIEKMTTFLRESRVELKKVIWPTREETIRYTATVIAMSACLAVFLGGLDYLYRFVIDAFLLR